jgi:glycosyltransferase involved in cell wall biosynthesis
VVRQFPPQGYGPAMNRAVREASGDIVVTLDCDDTYPVETIPRLAAMIENEGWDLVNTTRVQRRPRAMPLSNFVANRVFAAAAGCSTASTPPTSTAGCAPIASR